MPDWRREGRASLVCRPDTIRVRAVPKAEDRGRPVGSVGQHGPVHPVPLEGGDPDGREADPHDRAVAVHQVRVVWLRRWDEEDEDRTAPDLPRDVLEDSGHAAGIGEAEIGDVEADDVDFVADEIGVSLKKRRFLTATAHPAGARDEDRLHPNEPIKAVRQEGGNRWKVRIVACREVRDPSRVVRNASP